MLFEAGAIPKSKSDVKGAQPDTLDGSGKWEIAFDETARPDFKDNPGGKTDTPVFNLITMDQGTKIMLEWGSAIGYYKFYSQVYSLLGTVETSQYTVFERLTEGFSFFKSLAYGFGSAVGFTLVLMIFAGLRLSLGIAWMVLIAGTRTSPARRRSSSSRILRAPQCGLARLKLTIWLSIWPGNWLA